MRLTIQNFTTQGILTLLTLGLFLGFTFSMHAEIPPPTNGDSNGDVADSNWFNDMHDIPPTSSPNAWPLPAPDVCLVLKPNDYNLIIAFHAYVADTSLGNYPAVYFQGAYGDIPYAGSTTISGGPSGGGTPFKVGPLSQDSLVPFDVINGQMVYRQTFLITISMADRCPDDEPWLMGYLANPVKIGSGGNMVPYQLANYPGLFPNSIFDVGPTDPTIYNYKALCCPVPDGTTTARAQLQEPSTAAHTSNELEDEKISIQNRNNTSFPAIKQTTPYQIKVYPSPFKEELIVDYQIEQVSTVIIELINSQGQVVRTEKVKHNNIGKYNTRLNTAHLPKGMYVCRIVSKYQNEAVKLLKI